MVNLAVICYLQDQFVDTGKATVSNLPISVMIIMMIINLTGMSALIIRLSPSFESIMPNKRPEPGSEEAQKESPILGNELIISKVATSIEAVAAQ
jgi:hypothetical protein